MSTILYSYHNAETPDDLPRRFVDEARERKHLCRNCGLAESVECADECLRCFTAIGLAEDPEGLAGIAERHSGTPFGRALSAEMQRQSTALSGPVPNLRVRQAS